MAGDDDAAASGGDGDAAGALAELPPVAPGEAENEEEGETDERGGRHRDERRCDMRGARGEIEQHLAERAAELAAGEPARRAGNEGEGGGGEHDGGRQQREAQPQRLDGAIEQQLERPGEEDDRQDERRGPVVTLYELEPAPGIKASRIIGLADDIARSMSAISVRVAVVPGRTVIGIELPNLHAETVFLRALLDSPAYEKHAGPLVLVLGK